MTGNYPSIYNASVITETEFCLDKAVIFEEIKKRLISEFEIDAETIALDKNLSDDLGLDSLDAVDLLNYLRDHIGERFDPALFKNARTVQDVVDLVYPLWK